MIDRKTFEYGGYHFTPIRKFYKKEGDFFAISKRLASDPNLGLCTYQERQKVPLIIEGFMLFQLTKNVIFSAAKKMACCMYREKTNFLFTMNQKQKKRNSIADALSQSRNVTDATGISGGRQSSDPER